MANNLDNILLFVSLFLALAIFVSVAFGCAFRKNSMFESFANKKKGSGNGLSKFENQLLEGISSGKIGAEKIEQFIKSEKFTKDNLSNMIKHVEKMKNSTSPKNKKV